MPNATGPPVQTKAPCLKHLWKKCEFNSKTCKFRHEYPTTKEWENPNFVNAFKKFVEQWGIPPNFPMPKALAAQLADDAAPAPSPKTEPGDNAGGETGATAKAKKYTFGEGWAGVCI